MAPAAPVQFRGISLWGQLRGERGARRNRFVMSEYHANGFPAGAFAIRSGRYKYVECVGERPMLFDLEADPDELHDLALEKPNAWTVRSAIRRLQRLLYGLCSPEAVDARAKRDQRLLRKQLEASGQLVEEMYRRGYERNQRQLVTRPEILPPPEYLSRA